ASAKGGTAPRGGVPEERVDAQGRPEPSRGSPHPDPPSLVLRSPSADRTAMCRHHASIGISLGAPPGGAGRATSANVASGREFLLLIAGTTGGGGRGGLRRRRRGTGARRAGDPPTRGLVPPVG